MVEDDRSTYDTLFTSFLPIIKRRRRIVYMTLVAAAGTAIGYHYFVGQRYEAYVLLRVGQGIKDRTPGQSQNPFEGVDLAARIDSVARIGMTDYVIRQAASQVGFERLAPAKHSAIATGTQTLAAKLFDPILKLFTPTQAHQIISKPADATADSTTSPTRLVRDPNATIVDDLREDLSSRQEGRSDILRISYRASDPALAAEFVNSLAYILVANYADVTQIAGAESFFQQQTRRLEEEAEKAAAELQAFSVNAQIYSVVDQRTLLLKRLNDLAAQLTATRGSMVEKKGFKQALMDELLLMRPVYQSKMVSSIVRNIGGPHYKPSPDVLSEQSGSFGELPPILLIKVYQDNMSSLMKTNADLMGLSDFEKSLDTEIEKVNDELVTLASKEAEYNRLRGVLSRASAAAENYGNRTIEEKINSDIAKRAQLSSVRVVQTAEVPDLPIFPRTSHLALLTLLLGIGSGAAAAVMIELGGLRSTGRPAGGDNGRVVAHIGQRYYRRDEMLGPAE
ncbi:MULTISPECIES: hypothetical protein [Rhodopseudomonas]|uniref:hypothetical protein n=1 Tax=Rhodopseudomonas TaxID=1073 RepID=UPI000698B535|nr:MULTISPECIES: hypothetical protein [Rhodopseudomonas]MDF3812605.1 hypothetical protein [Rhodopseudomonas sp. BAL398]WOK17708.1 hypothetical protein RBJ75_26945 [Rhodopseudomonas sp. BAL398]